MIQCYEQNDTGWSLSDAYEYRGRDWKDDMIGDFGEENVAEVAKGVFAGREDERGLFEEPPHRYVALVVFDTAKAGDVDVNALMAGWEWPDE